MSSLLGLVAGLDRGTGGGVEPAQPPGPGAGPTRRTMAHTMVCRRVFLKTLAAGAAGTGAIACGGSGPTSPVTPPPPVAQTIRTPLPAVGETRAEFAGDLALA